MCVYVCVCVCVCVLAVYYKAQAQRISNREFKLRTFLHGTESRVATFIADTCIMSHQSFSTADKATGTENQELWRHNIDYSSGNQNQNTGISNVPLVSEMLGWVCDLVCDFKTHLLIYLSVCVCVCVCVCVTQTYLDKYIEETYSSSIFNVFLR